MEKCLKLDEIGHNTCIYHVWRERNDEKTWDNAF